ncbi:MAG: hypothetical protein M3541_11845 [Acidobacteriota bacterium]|nr:hypothetical protein [Acidobacteriota bacterium]MDQ3419453.1 hypothetical protein [Acidobacteriota bacterium]
MSLFRTKAPGAGALRPGITGIDAQPPGETRTPLIVWMALGVAIYVGYGYRRMKLAAS